MSSEKVLILGAIAGATIFLGLPVGRVRHMPEAFRALLNAIAVGILVFLVYDVLANALDPISAAMTAAQHSHGSWTRFTWLAALFTVCLGAGLLSLVYYDRAAARSSGRGRPTARYGPGAAAVEELSRPRGLAALTPARRLALGIALGIGLHNFSEGLAIGQSAAKGEVGLALLLIIGFGLHNATEGFGIVAPLAAEHDRPSWGFLAAMGVIGGGPTFLGTVVGHAMVSDGLSVAFLALAAGSILYVVVQLIRVAVKIGRQDMLMWGLFLGLVAGLATDFVLKAAGV